MKKDYSKFGNRVRKRLIEEDITAKAFCKKHAIAPNRLSELMHGAPYPKLARKVSDILGISA